MGSRIATSTELQNALTSAADNGEDDEIHIVQGIYEGSFVYASTTEAHNLTIRGGYTSDCISHEVDPINTVLDANLNGTVLVFSSPNVLADLVVEGVTLQNGMITTNDGGGLHAATEGNVTLNNCIVTNSSTTSYYYGGGIYARGNMVTLSGIRIRVTLGLKHLYTPTKRKQRQVMGFKWSYGLR